MTASHVWNEIIKRAKEQEFEVQTRPQTKRTPLWFRVFVNGNSLVISPALYHKPSVGLKMDRKISFKDFEYVYSYFDRWMKGEAGIREEVCEKSQNTTYIFALIAEHRQIQFSL